MCATIQELGFRVVKNLSILLCAFALIGCGEKNSTGDNGVTGNGQDAADPVESPKVGGPLPLRRVA